MHFVGISKTKPEDQVFFLIVESPYLGVWSVLNS